MPGISQDGAGASGEGGAVSGELRGLCEMGACIGKRCEYKVHSM